MKPTMTQSSRSPIRTTWNSLGRTLALIPMYERTAEETANRIDGELFRLEVLARTQTISDADVHTLLTLWADTKLTYTSLRDLMNTLGVDTARLHHLNKLTFIEALQ